MHGLQNMFYFERGKHSCKTFTQCSVSIFGNVLPIVTKCSALDVAGVIKPLNPIQNRGAKRAPLPVFPL